MNSKEEKLITDLAHRYDIQNIRESGRYKKYTEMQNAYYNRNAHLRDVYENILTTNESILEVTIPESFLMKMAHDFSYEVKHYNREREFNPYTRMFKNEREEQKYWAEKNDKTVMKSKEKLDEIEKEYLKVKKKHDVLIALTYNKKNTT